MHIGYLTPEYPPLPSGGIGTSIQNAARMLVARGHRVTVIGWGPSSEFEDRGVHVRFLGHTRVPKAGWWLNRRRAESELNRLVRQEGLEIVESADWCGLSAGMRLDCPVAVRCHGSATYFSHLLNERVRRSVRLAERIALQRADGIGSVSHFTAAVTRRLFRLERDIQVLPNGIDISRFRRASPGETEPELILYVGSILRKKGVLDLARMFNEVVKQRPSARLTLVGRDCADSVTGSASTWSLCEALLTPEARIRTQYLGPQPYEMIQNHFRRAGICVFPSYAEAFPVSWLEAMATGKPVIAYRSGWGEEMIVDGVSGLLVEPGDVGGLANAVLELLQDPDRQQAMGGLARARVADAFGSEPITRRTLEWYGSIVRGNGS